ncbi:ABC transporter ATP-binding protein [Paenibacillus sp. MBLB2552]|uniref:ABC transporter ATP-binding protein n=1 Tax=Paenibacillus mellifer TaxID=2937794 RepID=A0A9X2BQS1_9BACL|nr:ABC transporter ATP-binding protein [Paenibacillus mellifer]MCK8486515.1 ABC transporter ATP-binding protein [Paenibacillus mellifer]
MSLDVMLEQVSVNFGSHRALTDITLELEAGKIYGLLGRNGAGKTTLLSLLASYIEPTAGQVRIGGRNPFEHAETMAQVSFVFETDYSEESEKVRGMLQVAERYRPHFDRAYAEELIHLFGLPQDVPVKKLSSGMQSALNAVIGLASRSPVTIFDEVYRGMDAPTREIFYKQLLEDQAGHPRTIILSTHLVSEMDYLFEDVVILHKGRMLLKESIDRLLDRGASITGTAADVDEFVRGMKVLNVQQLGGTKAAMVYGEIDEARRRAAAGKGLDIGPVPLQDLFIHLTGEEGSHEVQSEH